MCVIQTHRIRNCSFFCGIILLKMETLLEYFYQYMQEMPELLENFATLIVFFCFYNKKIYLQRFSVVMTVRKHF